MEIEDDTPPEKTISDIPEEILEYILSLLSPYRDLKSAMRVCRLWNRCVLSELIGHWVPAGVVRNLWLVKSVTLEICSLSYPYEL